MQEDRAHIENKRCRQEQTADPFQDGAALLSGRKAAEAVVSGDLQGYGRWIDRDRMFDRRFMEVHREFTEWTTDEIEDALSLLSGNVNIFKGLVAMMRRPKYSRMYLAVWLGFRVGW